MASEKKNDQSASMSSKNENATREMKPGFWYLIAGLVAIFLMLLGSGVFTFYGSQLPEIYSTAMTLCLSCIGLGEINFTIFGTMVAAFAIFMLMYGLTKHDKTGDTK